MLRMQTQGSLALPSQLTEQLSKGPCRLTETILAAAWRTDQKGATLSWGTS